MFFTIDQHNGVAIYEQLDRQVKFAIAEGTLQPGQFVPSSRIVSSQLASGSRQGFRGSRFS